jgi:hypothetical protein
MRTSFVKTQLGHTTLQMTARNSHATPERWRAAVNAPANGQVLNFIAPISRQVREQAG